MMGNHARTKWKPSQSFFVDDTVQPVESEASARTRTRSDVSTRRKLLYTIQIEVLVSEREGSLSLT